MALPEIDLKALSDEELLMLRQRLHDEADRRYVLNEGAQRLEETIAQFIRAGGQLDNVVARARARRTA